MSAVRGFTTLQLLELAAIAEANRLRDTNQIPISVATGQPEDLNRTRTVINQLEGFLSQGGRQIVFPAKARGLKLQRFVEEALLEKLEELEDIEDVKRIRFESTKPLATIIKKLKLDGKL